MIKLEGQVWVEAFIVSLKGGWSHDTSIRCRPRRIRGPLNVRMQDLNLIQIYE